MSTATDAPEAGELVRVRGQQWVVARVSQSRQPVDELAVSSLPGRTLVQLTSVSDDDLGEDLTLAWEVEPGLARPGWSRRLTCAPGGSAWSPGSPTR